MNEPHKHVFRLEIDEQCVETLKALAQQGKREEVEGWCADQVCPLGNAMKAETRVTLSVHWCGKIENRRTA